MQTPRLALLLALAALAGCDGDAVGGGQLDAAARADAPADDRPDAPPDLPSIDATTAKVESRTASVDRLPVAHGDAVVAQRQA